MGLMNNEQRHYLCAQRQIRALQALSSCFPGSDLNESQIHHMVPQHRSHTHHDDKASLHRTMQEYFLPRARVYVNGIGVEPLRFAQDRLQTHHTRRNYECHGLDGLNQVVFCSLHVALRLDRELKVFAFVYFAENGLHVEKIIISAIQDTLTNHEVSPYFYN